MRYHAHASNFWVCATAAHASLAYNGSPYLLNTVSLHTTVHNLCCAASERATAARFALAESSRQRHMCRLRHITHL
jgi:hypothetical protein